MVKSCCLCILSPVRWSVLGATRHFLKKASVSGSTTSRRVSLPPALIKDTTSECVFPSTDTPFTWGGGGGRERKKEILLFLFLGCLSLFSCRSEQTVLSLWRFLSQYYHFVCQSFPERKSCMHTHIPSNTHKTHKEIFTQCSGVYKIVLSLVSLCFQSNFIHDVHIFD